ncbi:MAG: endonuclease domain-containing protein [Hyphomonadaceae bacterium]|nr:endonuclease domain-containing protein [Hyphomonadaceae bacterium]
MTPNEEASASTSSSTEEVAAQRLEVVRDPAVKTKPHEAHSSKPLGSPPQSALRADSSSIEEERGAKSWLRRRAKQMRGEMTPHEQAMWRLLHEGELVALNWRKQAPFGDYILDFVSHPARLVIEVDGGQHAEPANASRDAERTEHLRSEGYQVIRFWNGEALGARDDVWRAIQNAALETPAAPRMLRWREEDLVRVQKANAQTTSSSMEEVAAQRPEEVRAPAVKTKPHEAHPSKPLGSPPQSALRADSSSIEEERS